MQIPVVSSYQQSSHVVDYNLLIASGMENYFEMQFKQQACNSLLCHEFLLLVPIVQVMTLGAESEMKFPIE